MAESEQNEDPFLQSELRGSEVVSLANAVYQIWLRWSDFELIVLTPLLPEFNPPRRIMPAQMSNGEMEFVYSILDYGNRLLTSKQEELFTAGLSMCKMHYTIEKMIALLMEKLRAEGVSQETEVQVAFSGHENAQRKAFEVIINLDYNLVVTNFDPGAWGEKYLRVIKILAEKGYGYPSKAPRDIYKQPHGRSAFKPK